MEQEIERLRAEIADLRQQLAASQAQVAELTQQLATALERIIELEAQVSQRKAPPAFVKATRRKPAGERSPRKKRAAVHNTSRQRMVPTRRERHALERCPDCDYPLRGESVDYTREVIELPAPQPVEVIEHQVIKRWCPVCQKWHSPQLDLAGQVLGQGRMGVRIAGLVASIASNRAHQPAAAGAPGAGLPGHAARAGAECGRDRGAWP